MYRGVGNGVELFKGAKNKDGTICPGVYSPNVRKYYIEKSTYLRNFIREWKKKDNEENDDN